jgi:hypothetical protein
MKGMRYKFSISSTLALVLIAAAAFLTAGCSLGSSGNMAFNLRLDGYPAGEGVSGGVSIAHGATGRNLSKNTGLSGTNYGYALFSGVDEGTWTVSVSIQDGDTLLGATEFTVEASPGETTTTTVRGTYSGESMTFGVTSTSTQPVSELEISEFDAFLTFARREGWHGYEPSARGIAFGNFSTVSRATLLCPDGLTASASGRAPLDWLFMNVHNDSLHSGRGNYGEAGNYILEMTDLNEVNVEEADTITLLPTEDFRPVITSHSDGGTVSIGQNITWDFGNSPEVETVAVVVFDESSPETRVYSNYAYAPGLPVSFGPIAAGIAPGPYYSIIVMTFDVRMDSAEFQNFDTYEAWSLPEQAVKHITENISAFAYYEVRVQGS